MKQGTPVASHSIADAAAAADPLLHSELLIASRLTRIFAWGALGIAGVIIPVIAIAVPGSSKRIIALALVALTGATGLLLLRWGRTRMAARVVLWSSWSGMAAGGMLIGSMSAPGLCGAVALTAFASLALGLRDALALCVACALLFVGLILHEHAGPPPAAIAPELRALMYLNIAVLTAIMLWSMVSVLRATVIRAHAESRQRAAAEQRLLLSDEQLRAANAQLEARVSERTAQLAAANRELEAFSYSVAHDLRAPLRAIDGFSLALIDDLGPKVCEAERLTLTRIRAASLRMGEQIDGLLRLSRLTRAELKTQPIAISDLARTLCDDLHSREPARNVTIDITPDLHAHGDPGLVRVLLENLLGNAFKYTSRTAAARIEFGQTDDGALFVRDNGAGFDMAYVGKLFNAFQRLHAVTEFEGNGIGLATASRIVTRHGGRIWAQASMNKGATFFFTLPTG